MKTIKLIFKTILDLFLFRKVVFMEWKLQIAYGVGAWGCIIIIVYYLINPR
jgi:hypothetical protein